MNNMKSMETECLKVFVLLNKSTKRRRSAVSFRLIHTNSSGSLGNPCKVSHRYNYRNKVKIIITTKQYRIIMSQREFQNVLKLG